MFADAVIIAAVSVFLLTVVLMPALLLAFANCIALLHESARAASDRDGFLGGHADEIRQRT
jgi:hypothetical protein